MRYTTTCIDAVGQDINDMTDAATEITRRTFLKYVNRKDMADAEKQLGYSRDSLVMSKDWHVSYHKSTYQGKPCVYFSHSRIEWIFT